MGLSQSSEVTAGGAYGYHVHGVQDNSPAEKAGLEPFFDFILTLDTTRLNEENDQLKELLKASMEKAVRMEVYSTKTMALRELQVVPSGMWGGQGLLGASVRFCSYQGANENVWHVLDVEPDSPAALAGLLAHEDFIVGADQVLQDSEDFFALIEAHEGKPLKLMVYHTVSGSCREVVVTPNSALGCGIGYGYLHRIPVHAAVPTETPEAPPPEELSPPVTVTHGFTEAPLMAAPGQSEDQASFQADPAPPPLHRVMDPGFTGPEEDLAESVDRLDLSVSSIDMTYTSLAVRDDCDVSGVEELEDCDRTVPEEELSSRAALDLTSASGPPDSPPGPTAASPLATDYPTTATHPAPLSPKRSGSPASPSPVASPDSSSPLQADLHEVAEDDLPNQAAPAKEWAEPNPVASTDLGGSETPSQQRWDEEEEGL
ncbi:hypothetical protein NHX12_004065 [Muraenolepis orangiensis]|uniref:PDZ GRASP-type domain-containing protein n=1 Tax=Muraenolepis orangiensis TaxID=630683 RepID=A0A9Q0DUR9_9TELE|nr:hypothetical protein NHX12_004065 [Muraenolepis orangiensis]